MQRRSGPLLPAGLALFALSNLLQFLRVPAELLFALRLLAGLGMLLCFVGLHRYLAALRRQGGAGRLFGWYDASGKWAGSAAGLVAGLACQHYGVAMPFLIACLAAFAALAVAHPLLTRSPETAP
ncbi:Major Facilitator Superfamily protein [compost metagenome]